MDMIGGSIAAQARLTSIAQRHLASRHGDSLRTLRGDGMVLFTFCPIADGAQESAQSDALMQEVQQLTSILAREVVGRSRIRLKGEDAECDFSSLKTVAGSFAKLVSGKTFGGSASSAAIASVVEELKALPPDSMVTSMLDVLYDEVASESSGISVVTTFPESMCPTGARIDVVVQKSICIKAFSNTTVTLIDQEQLSEADLNMTLTMDLIASAENGNTTNSSSSSDADGEGGAGFYNAGSKSSKKGKTAVQEPLAKILLNVRALAQAFASEATNPIEAELPTLWKHKSFTLHEAPEVLKIVYNSLLSFWNKNAHSEKTRVTALSLLLIVSGDVRDYTRDFLELSGSDWTGPWRVPMTDLEAALALCSSWIEMTCLLTEEGKWTKWDGGRFRDEALNSFTARLRDVVRIRQLLKCASHLIQTAVPDSLQPENIFNGKSATDVTQTSNAAWQGCVAAFEKEFSLIEDHLRGRIKTLFQNTPREGLVRLLKEFNAFTRRDSVRAALRNELETSVSLLGDQLDAAQERYASWKASLDTTSNPTDESGTLAMRIRAAVSCQAACADAPLQARKLFGRGEYLDMVLRQATDIIRSAQEDEQAAVKEWCTAIAARCQALVSLKAALVITAVDPQFITCVVHPQVLALTKEVRVVRSMCSNRDNVKTTLSESDENTLAYCMNLERVACKMQQLVNNFNTVCREVIPCTRPMLVGALNHAVNQICYNGKPRVVALGSYSEVESLSVRFRQAVESFSSDNRHIRRFHAEFTTQVMALHNVDLSRNMDQWRNIVDSMRNSFEDFLHQYHFENHDIWRRFWDCQVYKALECRYRYGLETLHETMQDLKVELIFKQGQVQFKPTLEAMREAYYVKVREFVSVPLRFRGLQPKRQAGGQYEVYPAMVLQNRARILVVYSKAVELFTKLNRVRKALRSHISVGVCGTNGAPDLDTLVDSACATSDNYTDGFQVVKERLRLVSAMEDTIHVDCFTISTIPVKASIAEQLRRLEEALLNSVRKSVLRSVTEIDDFVYNAANIVERQPTTMDEVGKANVAYYKFQDALPEYEKRFERIAEMNRLLRQHGGGGQIELGPTKSRWDHLQEAMASHHTIIDASVSKMRVAVEGLIQKFHKDTQRYSMNWGKQKTLLLQAFKDGKQDRINKGLATMKEQSADLADLKTQAEELTAKCEYFKVPPPDFTQLTDTAADVENTTAMWMLYDRFTEELSKLRTEDWLTFRSHTFQFEDFVSQWRDVVSSEKKSQDKEAAKENVVLKYIHRLLKEWSGSIPMLKFVRGDGYMTEHWNELFRLLEIEKGMTSDKLSFGDIIDKHALLTSKEKELKHLHARAQGEIQIRDALQDLQTWALEATFTLVTPAEGSGLPGSVKLISEWKDVMTQVSDNQALIGSLKDSPFYQRFADEAAGWETKLVALSEYLTLLNSIQRKWAYLAPIFARGALAQEQPRFKRADKEFLSVLRDVEEDPRVMTLAAQYDLGEKLRTILEQIERCQKVLNEYLEAKRDKFPRFYFISDEDLLEILGQSQNPAVIQAHLKKLFMGIHKVFFDSGVTAITHMISSDGEEVQLQNPVVIKGVVDVEDWLIELDKSMRHTLQDLLVRCVNEGNVTNDTVINNYPSQILQVAEQILFVARIESTISKAAGGNVDYSAVLEGLRKKLNYLTGVDISSNPVGALKVKALILDIIHSIEIVELLAQQRVKQVSEWWWQKQLRYYLDATGSSRRASTGGMLTNCTVRMVDASFAYTYEYQGNAPKLVHTPLTDKCYLVLTKGMNLGYGGNPYGPAGTGKTESVKALGSAMGRQVLVFNCDEGIDFKAMGRIFVGIVKCGAWGCFDEFNRLKIDQLSAISQMIQVIQEALKSHEPACDLLGRSVEVDPNSGIFVTLNPAGKGYGGRTKLPDNLKQLFREVAMSVPDNELITSTMLLSEGFTHARSLAKKVVELYKLCKQLMSREQHYDWGLRPLKAVLRLGGLLVFQWKKKNQSGEGQQATEAVESELIVQSLNINTLSKLTFDDARLFGGLMKDIFVGVVSREISYSELEAAVATAISALGLCESKTQLRKVLQLYEAMNQRMGVVLVGPSGSGKSTLLRILRKALQAMGTELPIHVMNPKAMPRKQLLGYMDPDTREWYDGVLSAAARQVVKEPPETRSWVYCDGDIDPEWIESLNSVLDDNKLLTMPNGVRIQFSSNVNFVFETHSLEFASPATVSRMGVIYLSEEDVNVKYPITAFLAKSITDEADRERLTPLVEKYVPRALKIVSKMDALSVPTTKVGLLNSALNHIAGAVNELDFACSLICGLGSTLRPSAVESLAKQIFELVGQQPLSPQRPLDTYVNRTTGEAAEFSTKSVPVQSADLISGRPPIVPTIEVQRVLRTLAPLISSSKPFILVGPEGCGKSLILSHCFADQRGVRVAEINCSAQTTSQLLVQKLMQLCGSYSTNTGRVLRPKEGDRLVLVLKDLNLPKPDKYGTVELHSFLQQLIVYHGFYDKDLEWIGVEKVQIVGSMNPIVSAGRYPVAPRLLAIVNIISLAYPTKQSLFQVYSSFFSALLRDSDGDHNSDYDTGTRLAEFAMNVYEKIRRRFEGEEYSHCIFSPRSVTSWICNTAMYTADRSTMNAVLAYEANRIFSDCLPKQDDRNRADKILAEQLATIGYSAPNKDDRYATMYVSWFSEAAKDGSKKLQLKSYDDIVTEMKAGMLKYSREFKELSITIIPEIVSWITRVDRVLSRPGGHLLLVGRPGVGRRNAVFLAAYMLRMEVAVLHMGKDYGIKNFRSDLRSFIQRAAIQNERLVLLVEDHNIVDEGFLEILNSFVSGGGEVPGLFTPEETDSMLAMLRDEAANDGFVGNIHQYYLHRLQCNLRLALVMDSRHERFLIRIQSNPGFLTKCEVLWMGTWSNDATRSVCKERLADIITELEGSSENKGFHLHRELFSVHDSFGEAATPQHFQTLMSTYAKIYELKRKASVDGVDRLVAGLSKLKEAEGSVSKIKSDVSAKKTEVEHMQKEADAALQEIQKNMEDSKEQRDSAEELKEQLREENKTIVEKRTSVEGELADIQPTLTAAREAVSGIRSEQLNEIRSLKAPPEPIRDVLEGVLALLGNTDTSWQSMRKFLGERGAKDQILEFDVKNLTPQIRENVSRLLQQKAVSFKPEVIHRASVAAAPMAAWVKATVEYARIMERIAPLTRQLEQLEANQTEGEQKLKELKKRLKTIDETVEKLRVEFSSKCNEAERLKEKLETAEADLAKAQDLLDKLSGEKARWARDAEKIKESNRLLPKRTLVAAAFLTYLAKEDELVRHRYVKQWCDRLSLPELVSVSTFLRTESDLLQYKSQGLPGDDLSLENAIVILETVQTPLVIDPANKAIQWVKNYLQNKDAVVDVASMYDERFTHTLELAIRFGKTLLVSEVDRIDPILFPVLRKDLMSAGAKQVVQLGGKLVDWQESFKIVLFTQSTDLHLPPDSSALTAEVNFSVTAHGLESQLLGLTIQHENPELEKQKVDLLNREDKLKMQLSEVEEKLLTDLANSQGNLLENTRLITSLNDVKTQAATIVASLEQSHALQDELDTKRKVYEPLASTGAVIFFLIKDMESVNRMYQFGLNDFLSLFNAALREGNSGGSSGKNETGAAGGGDVHAKIAAISQLLAQQCYYYVAGALFKKDRLLFGMHMVRLLHVEKFPENLWRVAIGAPVDNVGDETSAAQASLPEWAPPTAKVKFTGLLSLGDPIASEVLARWKLNDTQYWTNWLKEASPEDVLWKRLNDGSLSSGGSGNLTVVDCLLLVNLFRPDRLVALMQRAVLSILRIDSLVQVTSLENVLSEVEGVTPVLLITSSGADPSMEVQEVALRVVGKPRFQQVALGGGQTDQAMQLLRQAASQGDWIFLKNLHLVLDWASVLEKELTSMPKPHPHFRLMITTEPHDEFPSVLLRLSRKVTYESSPGMKQNMLRTFTTTWDEDFLGSISQETAQMLFGLAWFHGTLQERRNYIPQGWVNYYDFTQADLKSATDIIRAATKQTDSNKAAVGIDWITIRGLLCDSIYGGRVDNPQDAHVLSLFINKIFSSETLVSCTTPLNGSMTVPQTNAVDAVVKRIQENLGDVDPPSVFNLPENADRAVLEYAAEEVTGGLRNLLQLTVVKDTGMDTWRKLLEPLVEVWTASGVEKCTQRFSLSETGDDNPDPIYVFFVSEVNLLVQIVLDTSKFFEDVKRVVEGILVPSTGLRTDLTDLLGGRVPEAWTDKMDGPRVLKLWLSSLKKKYDTMSGFVSATASSTSSKILSSSTFDLVDFLRPGTFFSALRQATARATQQPLVDLSMVAFLGSAQSRKVQLLQPIVVRGSSLCLQGAALGSDGTSLTRVQSNALSFSFLGSTNVVVGWVAKDGAAALAMDGCVSIPLYGSSQRLVNLMRVFIETRDNSQDNTTLTLNGTALFVNNIT